MLKYICKQGVYFMKKKIIIGLSVLLVVLLSSIGTFAVSNTLNQKHVPSDYKVGVPFETAMKGNKPVVALFYVDWCGYCMRFMPQFKTIESLYKSKYNFLMVNVEDESKIQFVKEFGIGGFPTVYIIDPKYDNRFLLSNTIYMDLPAFRKELDRYSRIRLKLDQATKCGN
jgi:thiol-disulfide isomerase/thioredoxin